MNNIRITDLDELVFTVRDIKAKSYIMEAIDAYRGGAYRAAIISTWIAVTFDIISKIRELALQDDGLAKQLVDELDNAISAKNIKKLQNLENDLLDKAMVEFEFLTSQEHSDLSRLKEDRHLCAHPAFIAEGILFEPEPELVRLHIVHAVRHLLQHQPVQGKSALGRIVSDMKSATFPSELKTASLFLNAKYLNRAKKVLVQNLIVILLKASLRGDDLDLPVSFFDQILLTLQAIARKHPDIYETRMSEKLNVIVEALEDNLLPNVFQLLGTDARCWQWLGEPSRIRLRAAISLGVEQRATRTLIFKAMNIEEIKPIIISAFNSLRTESQIGVIASIPRSEFAEKAIQIYSNAVNYRSAESLGASVIISMIQYFSAEDVIKILEAVKNNRQIWDASGTPSILEELFDGTIQYISVTENAWKELFDFLAPQYAWMVDREEGWSNTNWMGLIKRLEQQIGVLIPPITAP